MMERISQSQLDERLKAEPRLILDFSSPGCAPCKKIAQTLPALLAELGAGAPPLAVAAYEVDITAEPGLAARFMVMGVPALIVFKEGKEVGRFNSLPRGDKLRTLLS
jgi:thioredoxin-like negative regulator of GroEL